MIEGTYEARATGCMHVLSLSHTTRLLHTHTHTYCLLLSHVCIHKRTLARTYNTFACGVGIMTSPNSNYCHQRQSTFAFQPHNNSPYKLQKKEEQTERNVSYSAAREEIGEKTICTTNIHTNYPDTMATIELNNRCHQLVACMSALRTKLTSSSVEFWPIGSDCNLAHGLDDARFMALVSDYLTGLRRDYSQLCMEHALLSDELSYVRSKWQAAEERTVQLEERQTLCTCNAITGDNSHGRIPCEDGELRFENSDDDDVSMFDRDIGIVDDVQSQIDSTDNDDDADLHDLHINVNDKEDVPNTIETSTAALKHQHSNRTRLVAEHFANYLNAGHFDVATVVCKRIIDDRPPSSNRNKNRHDSGTSSSASSPRRLLKAAALEVLAFDDRAAGRYTAAIEHMDAALHIYERTHHAQHPRLVTTLNSLAHLYADNDQPQRARSMCARALQLRRAACGMRHRSVAQQHERLAVLEQRCGNAEQALLHYTEALTIYTATHALDVRETKGCKQGWRQVQRTVDGIRERMADLLVQMGRLQEAAGVYKEWLAPTQMLPTTTIATRLSAMVATTVTPMRAKNNTATTTTPCSDRVVVASPMAMLRPMRPIWEVAEEIERQCAGVGAIRRQCYDSYELRCDYRQWWDSVRVHFPSACAALKRLAFVYRRMGMHYAAKMLEHCCTLQSRKRALRFPIEELPTNENDDENKENVSPTTSVWHLRRRQERKDKEMAKQKQSRMAKVSPMKRL